MNYTESIQFISSREPILSVQTVDRSSSRYRPDLDGLRAIAILGVVLYHAHVPLISGGFTGVDIFFVISGYLIGGHIFSDLLAGSFSYLEFYRRRAKRILPAFLAVLALTTLAALVLLSSFELSELEKSALAATLSVSNLYFWTHSNYFQTQNQMNPLLMTWSLGVEEQFYAVIPLLMVVLARIRRSLLLPAILAVCVLSFLLAWRELGSHPVMVFYLLPTRAWELGVGVALAVIEQSRKPSTSSFNMARLASPIGIILMLAPMFILKADSSFPGAAALPSVLGTALVIAAPGSWINRRLLSISPLTFIGRISYSWYLWHWPMLSFLCIVSGGKLPPVAVAVTTAASLGAAILSYHFVEQPFRNSTQAPVPLLLRYAVATIALFAACGGIWLSHGIPQRYPQLVQFEKVRAEHYADPCLIRDGNDKPELSPPCYSASGNRPLVALWGDSHAAALAPGIRPIVDAAGYDFAQLNKAGCRPLGGAAFDRRSASGPDAECSRFNRQALKQIESDQRIRIVIIADAWGHMFTQQSSVEALIGGNAGRRGARRQNNSQNDAMQFLKDSISSLQAAGKNVIVMGDVPSFDIDPLVIVWTDMIPLRRAIATWMGIEDNSGVEFASDRAGSSDALAASLLHDAIATLPDTTLVDVKQAFCSQAGKCVYRKDGRLFYLDSQHLSPDGARYALRDFHLPPPDANSTSIHP
jgi:peptidoglycan/LPS O-acetylase OafA/YrhL